MQRVNKGFDMSEINVKNSAVLIIEGAFQHLCHKSLGLEEFKPPYDSILQEYENYDYKDGPQGVYRFVVENIALSVKYSHNTVYIKDLDDFTNVFHETKKVYIFTDIYYNDIWYSEKYKKDIDGLTMLNAIFKQLFRTEIILKKQSNNLQYKKKKCESNLIGRKEIIGIYWKPEQFLRTEIILKKQSNNLQYKKKCEILTFNAIGFTIYLIPIAILMQLGSSGNEYYKVRDPKFILGTILYSIRELMYAISSISTECFLVFELDSSGDINPNLIGKKEIIGMYWKPELHNLRNHLSSEEFDRIYLKLDDNYYGREYMDFYYGHYLKYAEKGPEEW